MRILYAALLSLLLAVPAGAGTLAGVTLPDKAEVKGQTLVLNGLGRVWISCWTFRAESSTTD